MFYKTVCSGVFAAPFMKEEEANRFIRLKRHSGVVQEQVTTLHCVLRLFREHNSMPVNVKVVGPCERDLLTVRFFLPQPFEFRPPIGVEPPHFMDMTDLRFARSVSM